MLASGIGWPAAYAGPLARRVPLARRGSRRLGQRAAAFPRSAPAFPTAPCPWRTGRGAWTCAATGPRGGGRKPARRGGGRGGGGEDTQQTPTGGPARWWRGILDFPPAV